MLDDDDRLLNRFVRSRDPRLLEALVVRYQPLAHSLARRYTRPRLQSDDLEQVACVGLIKALQRFDPARGSSFTAFAVPTMLGEIRRYCRETLWPVHVPRPIQERAQAVRHASNTLYATLGRTPTVRELSAELRLDCEEILDALQALATLNSVSLDDGDHGDADDRHAVRADRFGVEDPGYEFVDDLACIEAAAATLTGREREAVRLRFAAGLNQREIAARIGVAEGRVGRILETALQRLSDAATAPPRRRRVLADQVPAAR